jgi:hypothetical protein
MHAQPPDVDNPERRLTLRRTGLARIQLVNAPRIFWVLVLLLGIPLPASADFMAAEAALRRGDNPEAFQACKSEPTEPQADTSPGPSV